MAPLVFNDFPVRSVEDILAVESRLGSPLPPLTRVVVVGLDRLDAAQEVYRVLEHAGSSCGWVIKGMDEVAEAVEMRRVLTRRKHQLMRILHLISAVDPSDLRARAGAARGALRWTSPGAAAAGDGVITPDQCRDLSSMASRVSWAARLAHLRVTAVRWYLEALIRGTLTALHSEVVFRDDE
uniref:Uncharacterized protein n=1 Tax=Leersia perrieri TaxID=77586 RepID=A0A0D9XSL2_9ORYZ